MNAVTIGAYADDARETLYWLVADTDFDYVMSYNSNTNVSTVLLKDTKNRVLKFNKEFIITGISLIGDLLFWTDNLNAPRKLNIKKYYPTIDLKELLKRKRLPSHGIKNFYIQEWCSNMERNPNMKRNKITLCAALYSFSVQIPPNSPPLGTKTH